MKALIDIDLKNPKAFHKGEFIVKKKLSSYFTIKKGEDLDKVMKEKGFSEQEIKDRKIAIFKGNPHWLLAEKEEDKKVKVEAKEEKEAHDKRFEELKKLRKDDQVKMLKKLKAEHIPRYEGDRIRLIMKLEK